MFDKLRDRLRAMFRRENLKGLVVLGVCIVGAIVILSVSLTVGLPGPTGPQDDGPWANVDDDRTTGVVNPGDGPLPLPGTGQGATRWFAIPQTEITLNNIGDSTWTSVMIESLDAIYYWSVSGDQDAIKVELGSRLHIEAVSYGFATITIRANPGFIKNIFVSVGWGGIIIHGNACR